MVFRSGGSDIVDHGYPEPTGSSRTPPEAGSASVAGPAAQRARHELVEQIRSGALRPGERLGAERDLAAALGVSRSTVRQALAVLERAGTVRRVPGRGGGTFVAQPAQPSGPPG